MCLWRLAQSMASETDVPVFVDGLDQDSFSFVRQFAVTQFSTQHSRQTFLHSDFFLELVRVEVTGVVVMVRRCI